MSTGSSFVRPFYPSFNGLRGMAILLVFSCHYVLIAVPSKVVAGMWVGVDLFFVLSGFLITGILYDSLHKQRYFRDFYIRRALRIFPPYYTILALIGLGVLLHRAIVDPSLLLYAAYLGNLVIPYMNIAVHNPTMVYIPIGRHVHSFAIGYFWSLCVEEQFYLIWPFLVWKLRSRKTLMRACVVGIVLTIAIRCVLYTTVRPEMSGIMMYGTIYGRADTLLVGAWIALWLRGASPTAGELRRRAYALMGSTGVVLAIGLGLTLGRWPSRLHNPFIDTIGYTVIALFCAGVLLLSLIDGTWVSRALQYRPLAHLGAISYGFYLYHDLFAPTAERLTNHFLTPYHLQLLVIPIGFALTYGISMLSFHYLESRFLRLKDRFAPQAKPRHVEEPQPI